MKLSQYLMGPAIGLGLVTGCVTDNKEIKSPQPNPAGMVTASKIAPGSECEHGGMRFEFSSRQVKTICNDPPKPAQPAAVASDAAPDAQAVLPNWPDHMFVDAQHPEAIAAADHVARVEGSLTYSLHGMDTVFMPELVEVQGDLFIGTQSGITNDQVKDLRGLAKLRRVGGTLYLVGNVALQDIGRLTALEDVKAIVVVNNPALTHVDGLNKIKQVESLEIIGNASLQKIAGLDALEAVQGGIRIDNNPELTQVEGLAKLTRAGEIRITNNGKLTSLAGLTAVKSVEDTVTLAHNASLPHVNELASLEEVAGTLELSHNAALGADVPVGLPALKKVHALRVEDHPNLRTLGGFPMFVEANILVLRGNDKLQNLDMPELKVGGLIQIGEAHGPASLEKEGVMTHEQINHYKWVLSGHR